MSSARSASVFTHRRPQETGDAVKALLAAAREAGVELHFNAHEAEKHGLKDGDGIRVADEVSRDVDLCFALGGDGTILYALRTYAGTDVPVFGVNFGEIGFLATIEPADVRDGFPRALAGDFEVLKLPALTLTNAQADWTALNDISLHRRAGNRTADLSYAIGDNEIGRVRCDGLVIATPAGSTGYNLANGGPVMAWGVAGYAVSFIAPHSLTARALVVAPDDTLTVHNGSQDEPVDVSIDGRPAGELAPDDAITARFLREAADLAQVPGSSFYRRLREKFGLLA